MVCLCILNLLFFDKVAIKENLIALHVYYKCFFYVLCDRVKTIYSVFNIFVSSYLSDHIRGKTRTICSRQGLTRMSWLKYATQSSSLLFGAPYSGSFGELMRQTLRCKEAACSNSMIRAPVVHSIRYAHRFNLCLFVLYFGRCVYHDFELID